MTAKPPDDPASDEEAARRRDEVLKRVLNTPPKPHHPLNEQHQRKSRPASMGRVRKGRSRP